VVVGPGTRTSSPAIAAAEDDDEEELPPGWCAAMAASLVELLLLPLSSKCCLSSLRHKFSGISPHYSGMLKGNTKKKKQRDLEALSTALVQGVVKKWCPNLQADDLVLQLLRRGRGGVEW
jgi:hypothetical protein